MIATPSRTNCGFAADIIFTEWANWPDGLPPVSFGFNGAGGIYPRAERPTGLPDDLKGGLRAAKSEVSA